MNSYPSQWTTEGFMQRFEELLPVCRTYTEAYQRTEAEHKEKFGRERYKNFDAFRVTRRQIILKK